MNVVEFPAAHPNVSLPFTEEAIALAFAEQHKETLRYVAPWSKWLRWDGVRWRFDNTLHAYDLVRDICREAAKKCSDSRTAAVLGKAATVAAVERLARADRRMAATTDQWDVDPWLLNTPDRVINLRTGESRAPSPNDYCTKSTSVSPIAGCPRWLAFLDEIMEGDASAISYLQRLAGYCLTGDTSEQALFFIHGSGANGKSVFVETIAGVVSDYHKTAAIETFTASTAEKHPTGLAGLRGARLVTASETEEGRPWAESRIKALTGGDTISARLMRQDYFEFKPNLKLVIVGNYKPNLRSVDPAIRRRFNLVPFNAAIPSHARDRQLAEKLRSEGPGILAWMIEGCLEWQRQGIGAPASVQEATASYLDGQDALGIWIQDCCTLTINGWASSAELMKSWAAWASTNGEPIGSAKLLASRLESRGLQQSRTNTARGFKGIQLK